MIVLGSKDILIMILSINLVSHKASLKLKENGVVKGAREFTVNNDLAKNLLTEIDTLLKDLAAQPLSIKHVEYSCKDAGLTTERIGQTVADTYNFALRGLMQTETDSRGQN